MVEIDTTALEKRLNFLVVALSSVDSVLARIGLVRSSRDNQIGVRYDLKRIGSRLERHRSGLA